MGDDEKGIDLEDFEKMGEIGNGAYGNVYKIQKKSNGKYYAAKILKFNVTEEGDQRKKFQRELHCHQTLDSPAVIKFFGYSPIDFEGTEFPVIITKYMENGCLAKVFKSLRNKETPKGWNNTKMVINILGISLGMKYLHDAGIIHRDLKPPNVLLDKNYYPKLTDFGTARHLEKNERDLTNIVGTPYYMAPEVSENDYYTFKVDVFSFGMVLYEFYANAPPVIQGKTNYQIIRNIIKGNRPNAKKLKDGPVKDLIEKCWSKSAEERPTFDDIIDHYTNGREEFWPDDVDEKEVDQYLNKFGLSLDPDKIVDFFLKHPHRDSTFTDKDEEEDNDDDEKPADDTYETPISLTTSVTELKTLLLEKIESMDYTPNECTESDIDEDDVFNSLEKPYSEYYKRARDDDDDACLYYIANSFRKGKDPFPQDNYYAFKYMKKAASLGSPNAIYGLAYLMKPNFDKDDDDDEKAEHFLNTLKIAVEFGSEFAAYVFGFIYSIGFHVEENYVMALVYLKYAADKRFPAAMLMYADRLRTIVNEKISKDDLKDLIKKSKNNLDDTRGYDTRTNTLRNIAKGLFTIIKEPHLADYISRVYYQKVIDNKKSTKEQKKKAQSKLNKLEDEDYLEDYSTDAYSQLFRTIR